VSGARRDQDPGDAERLAELTQAACAPSLRVPAASICRASAAFMAIRPSVRTVLRLQEMTPLGLVGLTLRAEDIGNERIAYAGAVASATAMG
jgi:hypothetical protein